MLNFRRFFVLVLLVLSFFTFSCEKEAEICMSNHVSLEYFQARGFNLSFREIRTFQQDIINNSSVYDVVKDVTLNVSNILIVNSDDIITVSNRKYVTNSDNGLHNQMLVNCNKIPMNIDMQGTTVYTNDYVNHVYKGTCHFLSNFWQNGEKPDYVDPYDKSKPGRMICIILGKYEFEMRDGILILKAPAQYSMGIVDDKKAPSVPLSSSEVENIIRNGVEGVDYTLFTRDGVLYVRIKNNLYQRRYNAWVYVGIADAYVTTTWLREQSWIIFDILDWDEIIAPYPAYYAGGVVIENRNTPYSILEKFGDKNDLETVTTPRPHCKR